ncbi:hypothetical protein SEA_COLUCCI_78 [Arthrobacter phage Colucci]|uniref:Uncharacterized protein n=1 Tax=Arthrobacter phage Colucci TaxID=2015834 RepID=A0A286N2Z0_9CAUD|nr:hypothetical protein FDI27_gp078 [Arthrobacter phage Colucci]ASX98747.1 hypothetical protein SEA_COLUCCI_78 [Arthrobacter phage Colucci]
MADAMALGEVLQAFVEAGWNKDDAIKYMAIQSATRGVQREQLGL